MEKKGSVIEINKNELENIILEGIKQDLISGESVLTPRIYDLMLEKSYGESDIIKESFRIVVNRVLKDIVKEYVNNYIGEYDVKKEIEEIMKSFTKEEVVKMLTGQEYK